MLEFYQKGRIGLFQGLTFGGCSFQIHYVLFFFTLIPKKKSPLDLDDYRPICLVGCIYKVISKFVASRLKRVIGNIISSSQSAFVPVRNLLDGVLVANEMVDYPRRKT